VPAGKHHTFERRSLHMLPSVSAAEFSRDVDRSLFQYLWPIST